jgi:hypothetical protein
MPITLQHSWVNRTGRGVIGTMRRICIIVITIHYAPIIIYAQKPNTKMAEDHPCIAALMVGMAGIINMLTEISQTPHIQECYS